MNFYNGVEVNRALIPNSSIVNYIYMSFVMTQLVWRVIDDPSLLPSLISSELSLLHRACLIRFTSTARFAGYYSMGDLSGVQKNSHPKDKGCSKICNGCGLSRSSKKSTYILFVLIQGKLGLSTTKYHLTIDTPFKFLD